MDYYFREIGGFGLNMVAIYMAALMVVRIMGKRALGELSLFDFVIMVGIGDVIAIVGLEQQVPLERGLLILVLLGGLEYGFSFLTFKYPAFSRLVEGTPTLLLKEGVLFEDNLAKEHISRADLRQELRRQGVARLDQVNQVMLEACGKVSVILKDNDDTIEDLNHQLLLELGRVKQELQELKAMLATERKS